MRDKGGESHAVGSYFICAPVPDAAGGHGKAGMACPNDGLGHIHKAAVTAALSETGPFIVVTPDEAMAIRLCEDVNAFAGKEKALVYPRGNSLSGMWRGLAGNMSLPG